jgi:hypothetical protein
VVKITINEKNALEIDLWELADSLTDDQRELFAKFVVFRETLITGIVDTVVKGDAYEGGWWVGGMADELRLKLLRLMPVAMRELVGSLLEQRDTAKAKLEAAIDQLRRIERHWPQEVKENPCRNPRRELCTCPWNRADVEAVLAESLGPNWQEQCTPDSEVSP